MDHETRVRSRAELLASCPGKAPSWHEWGPLPEGIAGELVQRRRLVLRHDEAYVRELHAQDAAGRGEWSRSWGFLMTAEEEAVLWKRAQVLEPAIAVASRYLDALPAEQAGALRADVSRGVVVVQVTHDAELVQADL